MKRDTAIINGIRMYYELHGSGPHLTLIGGLGTATWLWENNIAALSRHFSVLAFDNRGAGLSAMPEGPYSISQMSDDLSGLLSHLKITKTHILGVSMGGYIAQEFTLNHPEKVDRLMLVATTAGRSVAVPMAPEVLQLLITPSEGNVEMMREKFRLAFTDTYLDAHLNHLIRLRLETPQPPFAFMAQATAGGNFDRSADIHRITAPTLAVGATGDRVILAENLRLLSERIPNSQLIIYNGFAHQFVVENAAQFNHDIIDFLTKP